jgi:CDP-diacylglycerol--serine O-phosphatidyltransferase
MNRDHKTQRVTFARMVPNMLTVSAICAGMTAMQFAIAQRWEEAVIAIVIAAFIDGFDGAAARLLKASSKFGAELDSLSDFICFGVAPAIVLHLWGLHDAGKIGWIAALVFAVAVALRLARFNVMAAEKKADEQTPKHFIGIPSPVGGGLAILPIILSFQLPPQYAVMVDHPLLLVTWVLFLALMMVSRVPTFSSKQLRIPHKMMVPALALFGLLIAALINEPWLTLSLLGVIYIASLPISIVMLKSDKAPKDQLKK